MEGKSRGGKCCLRPAAGLLAALFLLIPLPVLEAQGVFVRGDCDQNQKYEITDPIFLLSFLFLGTRAPTCFSACDSNDSDALDISDPLYSLSYLFLGGPAPPPPFPLEDPDPTGTKLTCLNGRNPPHELLVTPKEIFFYRIGNVQALSVLVLNDAGSLEDVHLSKSTRYLSADEAISLISSQGIVTAKAVGEATVEVHYHGVTRSVK